MKRLIATLIFCSVALTQQVYADNGCCADEECNLCDATATVSFGWRTDDIDFRIGNQFSPSQTLSKALFDDQRSYEFGIRGVAVTECQLYFRGYAKYGQIYSGENHTTQFFCGDCPEKLRFKHRAGRGEVWDLSAGVGYQLCACDDKLTVTPIVGYSIHEQRVKRFGPLHTFFDRNFLNNFIHESSSSDQQCDENLSHKCFTSSYRARWKSPWLGVDFAYRTECDLTLYGSLEYHWDSYSGRGRWTLRDSFVDDFSQSANGNGQIYTFGGKWDYNDCWAFGLRFDYQDRDTRHGKDRTHIKVNNVCPDERIAPYVPSPESSGSSIADQGACFGEQNFIDSRLNRVEWTSASIVATATLKF